jgi:hypothetical protein
MLSRRASVHSGADEWLVCALSLARSRDVTGPLIQSGCPDYTIAEYLKCSSTQQIASAARPPALSKCYFCDAPQVPAIWTKSLPPPSASSSPVLRAPPVRPFISRSRARVYHSENWSHYVNGDMINGVGTHSINPSVMQILVSGDERVNSLVTSIETKEAYSSRFLQSSL